MGDVTFKIQNAGPVDIEIGEVTIKAGDTYETDDPVEAANIAERAQILARSPGGGRPVSIITEREDPWDVGQRPEETEEAQAARAAELEKQAAEAAKEAEPAAAGSSRSTSRKSSSSEGS